ncbi:unnamed protein product [Ilex paraguariensis]|uniref:MADS-box domain-containing protein n=1 Tax=Ilex paraguariensis TaxID=185542 RepID=A0ABC8SWD1_9AQUA
MGRGKLGMELIRSKKARLITFKKRKCGLMKKIDELSTLCGVEVSMIIYSAKEDASPIELEIHPADPNKLQNLITKYKNQTNDDRRKRTVDLSNFFEDRKRQAENELVKLQKKIEEAKYPTWDDQYNSLSEEQLMEFGNVLGGKLETVKNRFELIKASEILTTTGVDVMDSSQSHAQIAQNQSNYIMQGLLRRRSMQLEVFRQPFSLVNANDFDLLPIHYPFDHKLTHQGLHFDPTSMANPMMLMFMNDEDCSTDQFGGPSSSNGHYTPLNGPAYDPMSGMLENMMVNNQRPPVYFYGHPTVLPMSGDMQYPMQPCSSSQMHPSQMDQYPCSK